MNIRIIYAETIDRGRRTARVVDTEAVAQALAKGRTNFVVVNGGGVANCYGYPAITDGVVAVKTDPQTIVVWETTLPANKVTCGGVLARAIGEEVRAVMDNRYGAAKTELAQRILMEYARQEVEAEDLDEAAA